MQDDFDSGMGMPDDELLTKGMELIDGLYRSIG